MPQIAKPTLQDVAELASLARESFIPAHGHSAPKADIDQYLDLNFTEANFRSELANPAFLYQTIYHEHQLAGYSKIILNMPNAHIEAQNVTKLERLYVLKEFYGLGLGAQLFQYLLTVSKEKGQAGIWLAVWTENQRAIHFYQKNGFQIVGRSDFKISETHYNPNHIMFLDF